MLKPQQALLGLALLGATVASHAVPVIYDGITFPEGDISFADAVESFSVGGPEIVTDADFVDPASALGAPDFSGGSGAVSLGRRGSLILRFIDNVLTGSDDATEDLHIFEIGPAVEGTIVDISIDGISYLSVGSVGGSTASIDIDPFLVTAGLAASTGFRYVRLTDDGGNSYPSATPGADIDAVGAISTRFEPEQPPGEPVSEPGVALLMLGGLGLAARRRGVKAKA